MMKLPFLSFVLAALAAGPLLQEAGVPTKAASENFRLTHLTPNGGQAKMASERFRMESVVSPPPSCEMESERFKVLPLEGDGKAKEDNSPVGHS